MKWWVMFAGRKRVVWAGEKDEIDVIVDVIERFAPREYQDKRESFYYNYRIISPYGKALLPLLETISDRKRLKGDPAAFGRDLFLKLKDFYDPKDRLSLAEAKEHDALVRKFHELFHFFYGTKEVPQIEI